LLRVVAKPQFCSLLRVDQCLRHLGTLQVGQFHLHHGEWRGGQYRRRLGRSS